MAAAPVAVVAVTANAGVVVTVANGACAVPAVTFAASRLLILLWCCC